MVFGDMGGVEVCRIRRRTVRNSLIDAFPFFNKRYEFFRSDLIFCLNFVQKIMTYRLCLFCGKVRILVCGLTAAEHESGRHE